MKKILISLLSLCLLLCGCTNYYSVPSADTVKEVTILKEENKEFVKSVWFTFFELSEMIKNKTEDECKKNISNAFSSVKEMGFNTVTVQVRPYADAFYQSSYFPTSAYIVENQGDSIDFDPLQIMCDTAKKLDLRIEAWVNPYRVSSSKNISSLCDSNIAKKWFKSKKDKSNVFVSDNGIYFNPASEKVTELIVNGVKELAENYPVDAIHFDDYFYPTTKKDIDAAEFKENGGDKSLSDFRRECVSNMIKNVYSVIKSTNSSIRFGISPASNIDNDYNNLYADVARWAAEDGFCDYICPQIYFGFRNVYQPFMFTTKKWISVTQKDLYIGLPLYKAGKTDKFAAQYDTSIKNEFKNNSNIIARQITYLSKLDEIGGFYIFSYSSLFEKSCQEEVENMIKAMQ